MLTAEIKSMVVAAAERHERMDGAIFRKGAYEKRNGQVQHCSIGCVRAALGLNASIGEHGELVDPTGVPELVLRLSDHVFEQLPEADSITWTRRLWSAIPAGVDLTPVPSLICARLMLDEEIGLAYTAILDSVKDAARKIGELYLRRAAGDEPEVGEWDAAWKQADAAREQAYAAWEQAYAAWEQAAAAREQAYAAREQAAATWKQADAAREQAAATWKQADAAWEQADAAREQAYAAWKQAAAAREQADAARKQAYAAWERFWVRVSEVMIEVLSSLEAVNVA